MQETATIDIREITVKPGRSRKTFDPDKLQELANSIKENGLIQPIVLTKEIIEGVEKVVLVAGERRYRAQTLLALQDQKYLQIKYHWLSDLDGYQQKKLELEENVQRENLHWEEKNENIRQLVELEKARKGVKRGDPTAFKIADVAETVQESPAGVITRAAFAQALKDRPDIAEKVRHMPMTAAMSAFKRTVAVEAAQAAVSLGQIQTYADYKNGDSTQLVREIGNEAVDMILSDLPFGIPDLDGSQGDNKIYTSLMKQTDNLTSEDIAKLMYAWAPEWYRIMKPSAYGFIFFGWDCYQDTINQLRRVGFHVEQEPIIWYKEQTTSSFKGYAPVPCSEQLILFVKPPRQKRLAEPFQSLVKCSPVPKNIRTHPFEKPVPLLSFFIKLATNVGDVVYDPCAGTASTLLAAIELQRSAVGHELNQDHYHMGQRRIANLQANMALGGISGEK
jgi:ParB/RepB/Spo0J family partition protein